tara:strand:+ start:963 stop:2129 length:1167 start_codon:yes stop_codon:yes gene_type:complete
MQFYLKHGKLQHMDIEQEQMLQSVQRFCNMKILPFARKIDEENEFPSSLWKEMGEMGLLGICAPTIYGGLDESYLNHCKVMIKISQASASVGLSYIAHSNLCINQINRFGTTSQKNQFLPQLISGEHIGAIAISEPQSGSDAISMQVNAFYNGSKYVLSGEKCWITNGPDANLVIVYAKTEPQSKAKGITAFLVPTHLPGFRRGTKIDKLGMRGSNTCSLYFDHLEIGPEYILGQLNQGIHVLMSGLDIERVLLSAGPVGIQKAVLNTVIDYAKSRKQFNTRLCDFQFIQGKIADIYTRLQSSESFLYEVAKQADHGQLSAEKAASVYLHCSENGVQSALDGIQILGGNGYTNDYDVGRFLRDAKLYDIGGGTTEIRRLIIARALCKD